MARRHLGFEIEVWRAMPWWKSRLYEEGLAWEFTPDEAGQSQVETVPLEALGVVWG